MPTSQDMAIFVLTTTTTRLITLPLAHAHGVIIIIYLDVHNYIHVICTTAIHELNKL